jgi:hypothetical protein
MSAIDGSFLYRLEGRLHEIRMIGPVPDGVRMNSHFGGPVTAGEFVGGQVTGIDYFRVRFDGVGVIDGKETLTVEGQPVAVDLHGYILPPEGMPVPTKDQLTSPEFAWPDVPFTIEAFATFETAAPTLDFLNRTAVIHTGTVNMATGALIVNVHRLSALVEEARSAGAASVSSA